MSSQFLRELSISNIGLLRSIARGVALGGQHFDLVLSDEQAKVNVNVLLDTGDRGEVAARLRVGLAGTGLPNRVRIRTAMIPDARPRQRLLPPIPVNERPCLR